MYNTVNETNLSPGGRLSLSRGYIHVYNLNYQTSSLKLLNWPNFMWNLLGKWERKFI